MEVVGLRASRHGEFFWKENPGFVTNLSGIEDNYLRIKLAKHAAL